MSDFFCPAFLDRMIDQGIAHPRNRQNIARLIGTGLDFLSYMVDMCLDQTCISVIATAPDIGNNLVCRTHMIGIDRQQR